MIEESMELIPTIRELGSELVNQVKVKFLFISIVDFVVFIGFGFLSFCLIKEGLEEGETIDADKSHLILGIFGVIIGLLSIVHLFSTINEFANYLAPLPYLIGK